MKITYDETLDAGYFKVSEGYVVGSRNSLNGPFIFDYDETGALIGIEFLSYDKLIEFITIYAVLDE